jgi:transposase
MIYYLDISTVEAIHESHDTDAALACFPKLSEKQINSVEAIAMDMSSAYIQPVK